MSNFADGLGESFLFYGVDGYRFKLNDITWEVLEDPDDGYRSSLGTVEITTEGIFYREPIAIVKLEEDPDQYNVGFRLVDEEVDGWIWLSFGTNHEDSYYPSFYFNFSPMPKEKRKSRNQLVNVVRGIDDPFDHLFHPREA